MRNDTVSVPLAASRKALHARTANFNNGIMMSFTHEREALSEAVLVRVSLKLCGVLGASRASAHNTCDG